jgi:hypothetical protein
VNAVPLARDTGGRRADNVEADLFLLVEGGGRRSVLVVEVKDGSNDAWYAVAENLQQLRLTSESDAARAVFRARPPAIGDDLPHTGVVLAPRTFYVEPGPRTGKKSAAVDPARRLCARFADELGVHVALAVWDGDERTIELLGA